MGRSQILTFPSAMLRGKKAVCTNQCPIALRAPASRLKYFAPLARAQRDKAMASATTNLTMKEDK
jgi:hypothetical protein